MGEPGGFKELQEAFGIPGIVKFEAGQYGLLRATVTAPQADAHVYLHGAHVTHYQPRDQEPVLFTSAHSSFAQGKPIRGGVPLVFPWFGPRAGDPSAPMHGFARLVRWGVEATSRGADGSVTLVLALDRSGAMAPPWPHDFTLRYRIVVGSMLELALEVQNTSGTPWTFEEALHTYLAVSDVREVSIRGLAGVDYLDKTDGMKRKRQDSDPIRITGETDRVYLNTQTTCVLDDPMKGRRLLVEKGGSDVTVVWNPWITKAKALPDFGDEEWLRMLCIETCNAADHAITLGPGARHEMCARIKSELR
jgi:glucose-6-phosphate 1-epimerase